MYSAMQTIALDRVDFLAPDRVTDNAAILTLKNLVFEPLCRWRDGRIEPALFGQWSHDDTARHWRFAIRAQARFHDGMPVHGRHIVEAINAILDSRDMFGMRWSYARYFADVGIEADRDELRFSCPSPFADLPEVLSEFYLVRHDAQHRPLIGTGPYRVLDFAAGATAVLCPLNPSLPGLTLRAVPRAQDRLEALLLGTVDAAAGLEQADAPPRKDGSLIWHRTVNTLSVMAYLDCSKGAFADPQARLAANLALDRERLIADVYGGDALSARTVVSPWHTGFAEAALPPIPHDPMRAKDLLDKAGGPAEILIRTPDHMPERAPAIARHIADDLAAVGFAPRIAVEQDRPAYARQIAEKQMGDMALFDSSPHSTFRVLDDKISGRTRALWWQGYADSCADELIAAARYAVNDRAAAYGAALARLHQAPPWLYLVHPVALAAQAHGTPPLTLDAKGLLLPSRKD